MLPGIRGAGTAYAGSLTDRLARAEMMARHGKRKLVSEIEISGGIQRPDAANGRAGFVEGGFELCGAGKEGMGEGIARSDFTREEWNQLLSGRSDLGADHHDCEYRGTLPTTISRRIQDGIRIQASSRVAPSTVLFFALTSRSCPCDRQTRNKTSILSRGRDTDFSVPPAQIRTGGFPASGSYLR